MRLELGRSNANLLQLLREEIRKPEVGLLARDRRGWTEDIVDYLNLV